MAVGINMVANTLGTVVLVAAGAALTIFSFRLAGAEQYGLIGFYLTLNGVVAILDTGIGPCVVREVAQARAGDQPGGLRTILFTFQGLYIALTGLTALALIAATPLIVDRFISAQTIAVGDTQLALMAGAVAIALQRLRTVYQVYLEGLERQVACNLAQSATSVLRTVGVLGAMLLIAPTALVFVLATLAVGVVELLVFVGLAWRATPGAGRPRFSGALLRKLWRYLVTSSLAVALGALLVNADKIVVSTALPLDMVGRYIFLSQICLIVLKLVAPNVTAVFPRLTAAVQRRDAATSRRLYFAASQIGAVVVAAFMLGATFFGDVALLLLTGKTELARADHLLFALMAWAYALNALCLIPNALRMVEGFAGTALRGNVAAALLYLPAVAVLTPRYGVLAPAALWLVVNAGLLAMFALRAHRDALAGAAWAWIGRCLLPPLAVTAAVFTAVRLVLPAQAPLAVVVPCLAVATACAMAASVAVCGELRQFAWERLRRLAARPAGVPAA